MYDFCFIKKNTKTQHIWVMVDLVIVPDPLFLRAVSHCMLTGSNPVMELLLKGTTISTLDLQQINFGFVVFLLEL